MPSGKQSKRKRRAAQVAAPPPGRSKGQRRQASPRVLIVAAAVIILAAVGIVLGVVLGGGSSKTNVPSARGSLVNALPGGADVQRLLKGIPQRDNVLGWPSAPVTMVEYIDLQCPFCQQFEAQAMPTVISRYVRTRKLKVEVRVIAFIGPDSQRGRAAAIAAGLQNKLFNFAQLLYLNQGTENTGWLSDDMVKAAAASIPGLNVPRLLDERSSGTVNDQARTFDAQASADHVTATPTILVGKSGKTPHQVTLPSPADEHPLAAAIEAALR
jgi:protein-disulfide isomerase